MALLYLKHCLCRISTFNNIYILHNGALSCSNSVRFNYGDVKQNTLLIVIVPFSFPGIISELDTEVQVCLWWEACVNKYGLNKMIWEWSEWETFHTLQKTAKLNQELWFIKQTKVTACEWCWWIRCFVQYRKFITEITCIISLINRF